MYKGRKIMNEELGKLLYKAFFYNNKHMQSKKKMMVKYASSHATKELMQIK